MANQRLTRINEEIKRELAEIFRTELKEPVMQEAMVSVIAVETTSDLKIAKVFVSVLQNDKKEDVMAALNKAQGFIRKEIARRVNLRNTPEFVFKLDETIEKGMEMSKKIAEVMKGSES